MNELCEVVITAPDAEWLTELTRQLVNEGGCPSVPLVSTWTCHVLAGR